MTTPFMFPATAMPDWPWVCPWGTLEPHAYDLVMIDPPWRFINYSEKGMAKGPDYKTMSLDEIKALRVRELLRPDAVVMLWATAPMLDQAFAALAAWGLPYTTELCWNKSTVNDCDGFGYGYRARSAHEPVLLSVIGEPQTSKAHRSTFRGLARQHSRKPEIAYTWAESYIKRPTKGDPIRRADVFSRQIRPGWDAWGDEVSKFEGAECVEGGVPSRAAGSPQGESPATTQEMAL